MYIFITFGYSVFNTGWSEDQGCFSHLDPWWVPLLIAQYQKALLRHKLGFATYTLGLLCNHEKWGWIKHVFLLSFRQLMMYLSLSLQISFIMDFFHNSLDKWNPFRSHRPKQFRGGQHVLGQSSQTSAFVNYMDPK